MRGMLWAGSAAAGIAFGGWVLGAAAQGAAAQKDGATSPESDAQNERVRFAYAWADGVELVYDTRTSLSTTSIGPAGEGGTIRTYERPMTLRLGERDVLPAVEAVTGPETVPVRLGFGPVKVLLTQVPTQQVLLDFALPRDQNNSNLFLSPPVKNAAAMAGGAITMNMTESGAVLSLSRFDDLIERMVLRIEGHNVEDERLGEKLRTRDFPESALREQLNLVFSRFGDAMIDPDGGWTIVRPRPLPDVGGVEVMETYSVESIEANDEGERIATVSIDLKPLRRVGELAPMMRTGGANIEFLGGEGSGLLRFNLDAGVLIEDRGDMSLDWRYSAVPPGGTETMSVKIEIAQEWSVRLTETRSIED